MGNTPLGYLWGWSAPIQVTLCPIDSCYSLNRGIRHLERSFHLSSTQEGLSPPLTTLGDYHALERIITSHYPGGLVPPREDYHLSLSWGIITPREDYYLPLTRGIIIPVERIITSHNPGGLSPPREDYHLSPCRFRTVTPICRERWPAIHIWSTSSLTCFSHKSSCLVTCFHPRGYVLRALRLKFIQQDKLKLMW